MKKLCSAPFSPVSIELMQREVDWYSRYGRFADRITKTSCGCPFVIGDWSWNSNHRDRQEFVEAAMIAACHTVK